jgi:hypothetical protein
MMLQGTMSVRDALDKAQARIDAIMRANGHY